MDKYTLPDEEQIFPQVVDRLVRERPDDRFITSVGEGSLTWKEYNEKGLKWAARLASFGVSHGDIVASLMEAGLESATSWLGLTRLGAIESAINTEFKGRILAYAINNCGARIMVVHQTFLPFLEQIEDQLEQLEQVILLDAPSPIETSLKVKVIRLEDIEANIDRVQSTLKSPKWHDIACITYTSGTTGPSKAVCLPWGQMNSIAQGIYPIEDLGTHDVIYSLSPNAHFGSKLMPYLAGLIGGQVVMRKRFSGANFWSDVAEYGITTTALIAAMSELLMRTPSGPGPETSLRNIFMAPVMPGYEQFNERYDTRLCTVYNSTEGGIAIRSGWNPENWRACGRLREGYPGFEVRIVDENDIEVPDGEAGEVIIRSSVPWTMNAGYLNNPQATAEAWRNGWFHTGDGMKRTPEGEYIFVDRIKDAIRRRGENISSFEVETDVLANPDVLECAAVAVVADESEDELLLYVVPKPGSDLTPESLCKELIPRMARFMVPRYIEFIDELPRTDATLRVMKAELRKRGLTKNTWDRVTEGIEIPR